MSAQRDAVGDSLREEVVLVLKPLRRGSLTVRFVKCSKPGCACAIRKEARHGPYYSLTRKIGGKTHSRFLSKEQAEVARRQIEDGRAFRRQVGAYWEACEKLADEELELVREASAEAGEKGGSGARSSRRSRKRSKSS